MDESLQQIIVLGLIAIIVGLELRRRWRKKQKGKVGCDDCGPGPAKPPKEAPLRFYKRH
jgi:hypothetical protein